MARRDDRWPESLPVGSEGFVEQGKNEFGFTPQHREVLVADGLYIRVPRFDVRTVAGSCRALPTKLGPR
jgi:hypothetical protein